MKNEFIQSYDLNRVEAMRIVWIALIFSTVACRLEPAPRREIRAHTLNYSGVWHGASAANGARFCQSCHGTHLAGGENGEPSCLTCHGMVWKDRDPEQNLAPADHVTLGGIFTHHPNRTQAVGTCDTAACHARTLEGQGASEPPSCFLCHAKLWQ